MKNFILVWYCLLFFAVEGRSQHVTATTGGEGKAGNIYLTYTVGESFIETIQNDRSVLTQGFHQPTYVTTVVRDPFLPGTITVFPNPTTAMLQVELKEMNLENIVLALYDALGKSITDAIPTAGRWQTDLSGLAGGSYFLRVTDTKTNQSSIFKILKID